MIRVKLHPRHEFLKPLLLWRGRAVPLAPARLVYDKQRAEARVYLTRAQFERVMQTLRDVEDALRVVVKSESAYGRIIFKFHRPGALGIFRIMISDENFEWVSRAEEEARGVRHP